MKNNLWYLGFLSVVSLLYFVEGKTAFLWFMCFIPYFATYNTNDERLDVTVDRASRNAFAYSAFFGAGTIVYIYLTRSPEQFAPAFVVLFGGSLLTCLISLLYYDRADN